MPEDDNKDIGSEGGGTAAPWGDKTPEQIWADYQAAQAAADAYKTSLGGIDPDAAKQGWDWARQAAAAMQEGKLKYITGDEPPKPNVAPEGVDSFGLPDNYDELTAREQALIISKQIAKANETALRDLVTAEASKANSQIKEWMDRSEQEKGLLFQVLEASRNNPKLDVKSALEQAAKLRAATPDQLLQMAIERLSQPDPNSNFNERVSAAVAEKLQEAENKRLEAAFGVNGVNRKVSLKKNHRSRDEVNRSLMKQWSEMGFRA